jgi:hypothetical protein
MDNTTLENLRDCLGFVQNGTQTKVTIHQDDATKDFIVYVDNRRYHGYTLDQALENAAKDQE